MTLYIRMIKEDRLQIRKTRFPNHAKLYIAIDPGNKMCERTFITGSSNLTRAGLIGQAEFNVELSDFGVSKIAEEFFDELWQDSVQITEHAETKTKLIKLLTKEAQTREITPFEAYALALKTTWKSMTLTASLAIRSRLLLRKMDIKSTDTNLMR